MPVTEQLTVTLRLLQAGWRPADREQARVQIDVEAAREYPCGNCGQTGLLLLPFTCSTGGCYRAVVRCERCGFEEEF